ncbi:hypothetical protein [Nannocystis pusilla]|uniref:Uncharacterized protein n=1 Tax=Nannocystis pusilla TaxID=889268 RepID=A0ABS7U353_9BACT|nr:hypothetical protein [Nannocystis pusilla]MBZ5714973.1 hypothetical protein [Nannocystis pusilla]
MSLAPPRRTLMNLAIPRGMVQTLAWGMIAMPFALPPIAWELGWVRPPETASLAVATIVQDPASTGEQVDSSGRTLEVADATGTGAPPTEAAPASAPILEPIATCGNSVCEPARGESSRTCCEDCPCDAPLVCKPDASDRQACQAQGLK